MLQAQQHCQEDGNLVIDAEKRGRGLAGAIGEGDAGCEQVSVVIVAYQAFSAFLSVPVVYHSTPYWVDLLGGEGLPDTTGPIWQ